MLNLLDAGVGVPGEAKTIGLDDLMTKCLEFVGREKGARIGFNSYRASLDLSTISRI